MNLFELCAFVGAVTGLATGALVGHGGAGKVAAAFGCAVGGFFLLPAAMVAVFALGAVFERFDKRTRLRPRFGRYWRNEHRESWARAKDELPAGVTIIGEVVAEKTYGRFLDIGRGFPALLKAVDESRLLVPDLPKLGTRLGVTVTDFDDAEREIRVTQTLSSE